MVPVSEGYFDFERTLTFTMEISGIAICHLPEIISFLRKELIVLSIYKRNVINAFFIQI